MTAITMMTAIATLLPVMVSSKSTSSKKEKEIVSLPLVPHHAQQRRRLQEQGESSSTMGEFEIHGDDRRRLRRRDHDRVLENNPFQMGALYQGYGTHYVDLWVGTPPQRQTLIVDTGSGVTAFPCSGCTDCGDKYHIDKFFIEKDSSTFRKQACDSCKRGHCTGTECRISLSYQEGSSWTAYEAIDRVYIGGPHDHGLTTVEDKKEADDLLMLDPQHANAFSFDMVFGCQTHLTGLFKTQLADGIMGMDNAATAFWNQMHEATDHTLMKEKKFSLCFSRQPTAYRTGTEAGALTLGGTDTRFHKGPVVFTSNKDYHGGFFSVHVRKIYLRDGKGGLSAQSSDKDAKVVRLNIPEDKLNRGNTIVDSGTTDTYFTHFISAEFKKVYQDLSKRPYHHNGVSLSQGELESLPTILIQLSGDLDLNQRKFKDASSTVGLAGDLDKDNPYDVVLAIPPTHYMEWDNKQKKYVARFYTDEGSGSVLGANAMMGHDVYFDIQSQRIGWAESDCDYTHLVKENGFPFELPPQPESNKPKTPSPTPSPTPKPTVALEPADETTQAAEESNKKEATIIAEEKMVVSTSEEEENKQKEEKKDEATFSDVCVKSLTCRIGAGAGFTCFIILVVLLVQRLLGSQSDDPHRAYHNASLSVPNMNDEDDDEDDDFDDERFHKFQSRYRDQLDDEDDDNNEKPLKTKKRGGVEMKNLRVV